jgi:hypothetical protein
MPDTSTSSQTHECGLHTVGLMTISAEAESISVFAVAIAILAVVLL